jgi:hypothetical protein
MFAANNNLIYRPRVRPINGARTNSVQDAASLDARGAKLKLTRLPLMCPELILFLATVALLLPHSRIILYLVKKAKMDSTSTGSYYCV